MNDLAAIGERETLLDAIFQPISGDAPAGEDLRQDISPQSLYFRLRDARADARAAERQADNDPAATRAAPPQWATVRDLATEALLHRTKDIEIACWLTEGLTRADGLAGLADGADCLTALIDRFWDKGLFPTPDEQDPEARLIGITGMSGQERDGSLLQPLRKAVLFSRIDGAPVTFWDYERSRDVAALGPQAIRNARATQASIPFAELENEAQGRGRDSLAAAGAAAARTLASWHALEASVARVTSPEAVPATGRVRSLLEQLLAVIARYVPLQPDATPEVPAEGGGIVAPPPEVSPPGAVPVTRDAMLEEILRISAAFRLNEPGSPLSFTLDEAVRRARMPWPELLRELLPDLPARAGVMFGAGLKPPDE